MSSPSTPPGQVHLAEVGFQIDLVGADRHALDVPRNELQLGRFIAAEDPLGGHASCVLAVNRAMACWAWPASAPGHLAIFLQGLFQLAELLLQRVGDAELGQRGLVRCRGYFDTSRRQTAMAASHFSSWTFVWFISRRMPGLRLSSGYLVEEFGEQLVGGLVLLGLRASRRPSGIRC